jgi:hypothetical protein
MIATQKKARPGYIVDDRLDPIEYERVEIPEVVEAIGGERITDEDYLPVPELEEHLHPIVRWMPVPEIPHD